MARDQDVDSRTCYFFFFNDTATTEIYTLSLHDALPILPDGQLLGQRGGQHGREAGPHAFGVGDRGAVLGAHVVPEGLQDRSEEHTSELQSRQYLVCRLLLEKKKKCQGVQ